MEYCRRIENFTRERGIPGYVGGFRKTSHEIDNGILDELKFSGNLNNIPKITRMLRIRWPEFSYNSSHDNNPDERVFMTFMPDMARIGYTDEGEILSIVCPQIPESIEDVFRIITEVTVDGVRGWVDEDSREIRGDIQAHATIWIDDKDVLNPSPILQSILLLAHEAGYGIPVSKTTGMRVPIYGDTKEEIETFPGISPKFSPPEHTQHNNEAWSVCNLGFDRIGTPESTGDPIKDKVQQILFNIIKMNSGGMDDGWMESGKLAWNIWVTPPETVDTLEWQYHADRWLHSINIDYDGESSNKTDRYGRPIKSIVNLSTIGKTIVEMFKLLGLTGVALFRNVIGYITNKLIDKEPFLYNGQIFERFKRNISELEDWMTYLNTENITIF